LQASLAVEVHAAEVGLGGGIASDAAAPVPFQRRRCVPCHSPSLSIQVSQVGLSARVPRVSSLLVPAGRFGEVLRNAPTRFIGQSKHELGVDVSLR